jgi:DNA-binding NarL/FixJ family response regulator
MDAMNSRPLVILYEPRVLLRNGLCAQLQEQGQHVISCRAFEQITEEICIQTNSPKVLVVGAGGLGDSVSKMLRIFHYTKAMALKTLVYLPYQDELLTRLFMASGASGCLAEDELEEKLLPAINDSRIKRHRGQYFSFSEMNVLLDYASGMQTQEIAVRRNCSYKTVFTFKRNARMRLDIETKAGWMDLLTAINQLSSCNK